MFQSPLFRFFKILTRIIRMVGHVLQGSDRMLMAAIVCKKSCIKHVIDKVYLTFLNYADELQAEKIFN